ncbi:ATP-binding protein [Planctomicrobium sp. SH668]|uniref:ATP-binding protein n=1 Tax=Planctomicrobium sp. SH668 TaxID=3448126 RepID=UPI003F5C78B6
MEKPAQATSQTEPIQDSFTIPKRQGNQSASEIFKLKVDEIVQERLEAKEAARKLIADRQVSASISSEEAAIFDDLRIRQEEGEQLTNAYRLMNPELFRSRKDSANRRQSELKMKERAEARLEASRRYPELYAAMQEELREEERVRCIAFEAKRRAERIAYLNAVAWPKMAGRFVDSSLENFEEEGADIEREAQRSVLGELRQINLLESIQAGQNILFLGPPGAGKDHLMHALMRQVFLPLDGNVVLKNGAELRAKLKDASRGQSGDEDRIVNPMLKAQLLCISDPAHTAGASLSDFQTDCLYRVVEGRWRERQPTWMTINLPMEETRRYAREIFSAPVWDRLIDNAKIVICNWESFRECESVIQ